MQRTRLNGRLATIITAVIGVCVVGLLIWFDRFTKNYFYDFFVTKNNQDVCIIKNFFYFTYATNTGAGWSFLSGVSWAQTFFKVTTVIALAIMLFFSVYSLIKNKKWLFISFSLCIAGAVGNFIDRIINGFVIDFISFIFGNYNFPVFNVADICLTVGVIMLIVYLLFLDDNGVLRKNGKENLSDNN